jgi:hypothetical protein
MTFGGGMGNEMSNKKALRAQEGLSPETIEEDLERDDDYDFLIDQVRFAMINSTYCLNRLINLRQR